MINNKYAFAIEDAKIVEENPNSKFAIVELDFFASGQNLHNLYVSEETLLRTADTIKNCPLVWKYSETLDDIYTHDKDETVCGFVPETSEIKSRKLPDGRTMLSTISYVWKRYTGQLLDIFKRDGGKKPVSVEMIVYDIKRLPNGEKELTDFKYEGITILGSFVTPAIPLAMANVLSFSELEKEYAEDYKKEFSESGIKLPESFVKEMKDKIEKTKPLEKENNMSEETMQKTLGLSEPEKEEKVMEEEKVSEVEMAAVKEEVKEEVQEVKQEEVLETLSVPETLVSDVVSSVEESVKEEILEEPKQDIETVTAEMSAKILEMSATIEKLTEKIKVYATENEELKKFKTNVEESQKLFTVEQTIRELEEKVIIPEEVKAEMLADAANYAFSDIEQWKTLCKAKSFDFAVRESKDSSVSVKKAGLPFGDMSAKSKNDLWQ